MNKPFLSGAAMAKLLRRAGAERVSDSAKFELRKIIEEKALQASKVAVQNALKNGRKTVVARDFSEQ